MWSRSPWRPRPPLTGRRQRCCSYRCWIRPIGSWSCSTRSTGADSFSSRCDAYLHHVPGINRPAHPGNQTCTRWTAAELSPSTCWRWFGRGHPWTSVVCLWWPEATSRRSRRLSCCLSCHWAGPGGYGSWPGTLLLFIPKSALPMFSSGSSMVSGLYMSLTHFIFVFYIKDVLISLFYP